MEKDYELMVDLKSKTESSFKKLYDKYYRLIYYKAYLVLKNIEDSEDTAQKVFINFFNKIDELPLDLDIKNYLSKMASNQSIDQYRKNKKLDVPIDGKLVPSSDKNDLLINFNGLLDEKENNILILKINFDYSFNEIANELNETIGQVQSTYYKALKKIKTFYKESEKYEL